jgi:hypothetical protein
VHYSKTEIKNYQQKRFFSNLFGEEGPKIQEFKGMWKGFLSMTNYSVIE